MPSIIKEELELRDVREYATGACDVWRCRSFSYGVVIKGVYACVPSCPVAWYLAGAKRGRGEDNCISL